MPPPWSSSSSLSSNKKYQAIRTATIDQIKSAGFKSLKVLLVQNSNEIKLLILVGGSFLYDSVFLEVIVEKNFAMGGLFL